MTSHEIIKFRDEARQQDKDTCRLLMKDLRKRTRGDRRAARMRRKKRRGWA
jgi:hypothetical protein